MPFLIPECYFSKDQGMMFFCCPNTYRQTQTWEVDTPAAELPQTQQPLVVVIPDRGPWAGPRLQELGAALISQEEEGRGWCKAQKEQGTEQERRTRTKGNKTPRQEEGRRSPWDRNPQKIGADLDPRQGYLETGMQESIEPGAPHPYQLFKEVKMEQINQRDRYHPEPEVHQVPVVMR